MNLSHPEGLQSAVSVEVHNVHINIILLNVPVGFTVLQRNCMQHSSVNTISEICRRLLVLFEFTLAWYLSR